MSEKKTKYLDVNDEMLSYERKYWDANLANVAGVDEAGRGPLAGPVVVASVVFTDYSHIPLVNDSKKLSAKKRYILRDLILSTPGVYYKIIEISPEEIDKVNILQATHSGMRRSVLELKDIEIDVVLIDGLPVPNYPLKSESIVKGDAKSATIAAASILAKTFRDDIMKKYAEIYPEYGFEQHSGYGTVKHLAALNKYGITPIHRKSFAPVRNIFDPPLLEQGELF